MKKIVLNIRTDLEDKIKDIVNSNGNNKGFLVLINPKEIDESQVIFDISFSKDTPSLIANLSDPNTGILSTILSEKLNIPYKESKEETVGKKIKVLLSEEYKDFEGLVKHILESLEKALKLNEKTIPLTPIKVPLKGKTPKEEEILKLYRLVLGREPSQNDLGYLSTAPITPDQLIRKMVESEEHANIVKASQEVLSARKSFFDQQNSIEELTAELKDSKNEIVQLNGLIGQKNASVEELKAKNDDLTLKVKGYESAVTENEQPTFIDKILDYLNRKFG
jgi:hypothetical protein